MCDLEKEVKLLREKVELLEKVKKLETKCLPIPNAFPYIYPLYPNWDDPNYTRDPYPYNPFTTLPNHYPTTSEI